MGSSEYSDERPVHHVRVSAFEITATEITTAQFVRCVKAGTCKTTDMAEPDDMCNALTCDRREHPMNCVSWSNAQAFCRWKGGSLPTEAQWEYAAQSMGKQPIYPWGSKKPDCTRAVMDHAVAGCGKESTWPVCSKPAGNSAQGICDISGNVAEWVQDWYSKDYYRRSPKNDPPGATSGELKIIRGGSWSDYGYYLRVTHRGRQVPKVGSTNVGFRCARPLTNSQGK